MKILDNIQFNDTLLDVTKGTGGANDKVEASVDLVLGKTNSISLASGNVGLADAGGIKVPNTVEAGKAKATSGVFTNLSVDGHVGIEISGDSTSHVNLPNGSMSFSSGSVTNLRFTNTKTSYPSSWHSPTTPADGSVKLYPERIVTTQGSLRISGLSQTYHSSGEPPGYGSVSTFDDELMRVYVASTWFKTSGDPPESGDTKFMELKIDNAEFGSVRLGPAWGGLLVEDGNNKWYHLVLSPNGDGTATATWQHVQTTQYDGDN